MLNQILTLLVVALLLQYGEPAVKYDNDPWSQYVNDQVDLDDLKEAEAYNPKYDEAMKKERLATAAYDKPERWLIQSDDAYYVLLYGERRLQHYREGNCGGVILTINVVMTLCSCVASYLRWILGPSPTYELAPFAEVEDLGKDIWVVINAANISYTVYTPYQLINQTGKGQLPNTKCMAAFKDATATFKKAWEQRTNIALLKFTPDYPFQTANTFVPWPPIPLLYDMTLNDKKVKESNMWAVHPARSPQSVFIPSYLYQNYHVKQRTFVDPWGEKIDVEYIRAGIRATLCDQDFCVLDYPDIDRNVPSEERRRFSCFCDDNYADTVCKGLYGSPVIHDGDLHGLLAKPLLCNPKHPRGSLAIAIDGPYMDYIVETVPGITERLEKEINATQFREKVIVSNYEVYLPQADLLPHDIDFTEVPGPRARSFSFPLLPSLTRSALSVFMFIRTIACT